MKTITLTFIFLMPLIAGSSFASESCNMVYQNIIRAIGRFDPPAPKIVFRNSPNLTAEIRPNGEIHVGEKFIETCRNMGPDSLNAMALVLAHELAHHYQNHFWAKEYGTAYADVEWGRKVGSTFKDMKEMGVYESQADEFGMFYAYVAGYNTLGLAATLFERIYNDFELPESLPGYPELSERKKIAELSEERVKRLIPIFEAGKLMSILASVEKGDYRQYLLKKSSECFEKIIDEKFTSREIYNNLGVTYLLSALGLIDESENKFSYPVMLDDESRLYDASGNVLRSTKGLGFAAADEINKLLDEAEKYFNHAKTLDKNYIPAFINLACVADLRSEFEEANFNAGRAIKLSTDNKKPAMKAYALEVQAISLARQDLKKDAEKKFNEAKAAGSLLSDFNLAALKNEVLTASKQAMKLSFGQKAETVNNKSLYELLNETDFYNENMYKLRGDSRIIKTERDNGDLFVIECTDRECPYNTIVFHQTHADYLQPTARDIRIGNDLKKVTDAYGRPDHIMPSGSSDYYIFKNSNIIFKMQNGRVGGWAVYFHV